MSRNDEGMNDVGRDGERLGIKQTDKGENVKVNFHWGRHPRAS
jgi:hypothetical protein